MFCFIDGLLLEEFIIEHLPALQEESHPSSVQDTAKQEDGKHHLIIYKEHHRKHHEGKHGKGDEILIRMEIRSRNHRRAKSIAVRLTVSIN